MNQEKRIWTIANGLTMVRGAFVPVFCWFAVQETIWFGFAAIAVFLLASVTDAYDGKIARARNEITDFGKLADPIADKALTGAAFVILSMQHLFPWWATVVLLGREWGITVWRLMLRNRLVHAANRGGKLKTTLQITGIAVAFWPREALLGWLIQPLGIAVVWCAFAVTLWTGWLYARELAAS